LDYDWNADFETMKPYSKNHLRSAENNTARVVLNVNFPKLKKEDIRKICRQAKAMWVENSISDKPQGRDYYWLAGEFINKTKEDTDEWACLKTMYPFVRVQFDLTAHHASVLLKWNE
jgi:5'-nucleotidase